MGSQVAKPHYAISRIVNADAYAQDPSKWALETKRRFAAALDSATAGGPTEVEKLRGFLIGHTKLSAADVHGLFVEYGVEAMLKKKTAKPAATSKAQDAERDELA